MAGSESSASFDLSGPAAMHYGGMIRLPRLITLGFLVLFVGVVIFRLIMVGFEILLLPFLAGIAVLAWMVLLFEAPGPIALRDHGTSVEFLYPNGRVRSVDFSGKSLPLRLLERVSPDYGHQSHWALKKETDFLAIVNGERIALTLEAYLFLDQKAIRSGFEPVASVTEKQQTSGWRIRSYIRMAHL